VIINSQPCVLPIRHASGQAARLTQKLIIRCAVRLWKLIASGTMRRFIHVTSRPARRS